MTVRIEDRDLGGGDLEAYGVFKPERAIMAVRPDLPSTRKRARVLEGYGCWIKPPIGGRRICYTARSVEDLDPVSVRAIRRTVDQMEPDWVRAVKEECRVSNDLEEIADRCDLDIQAVAAIIRNLQERGELPPVYG